MIGAHPFANGTRLNFLERFLLPDVNLSVLRPLRRDAGPRPSLSSHRSLIILKICALASSGVIHLLYNPNTTGISCLGTGVEIIGLRKPAFLLRYHDVLRPNPLNSQRPMQSHQYQRAKPTETYISFPWGGL